jgi:geranylgeranyl pyrophosphate synthase
VASGQRGQWRATVAEQVRIAIQEAVAEEEFRTLLLEIAARESRILHPTRPAHWHRLVLATCEALGGNWNLACWPAAAVEFVACATDVVDDLADVDWDAGLSPASRAVNASFALTWLAQYCVNQAAEALSLVQVHQISQLITDACVRASCGEDSDLRLEADSLVTEEQAHETSWKKSGTLVSMACQVGAACTSQEQAVIDTVGDFGAHIGMVAQLLNDIAGVDPAKAHLSTDLARRKKTLPVAFALQVARSQDVPPLLDWYRDPSMSAPECWAKTAEAIARLGGLHYAWVVADVHRREALSAVRTLSRLTGRRQALQLAKLVPTLRS